MLQGIVPSQSFELIRDRIGEILANELANQFTLSGDDRVNAGVFVERIIPINHTETPLINVMLDSGDLDEHDQIQTNGTYTYNIDVFAKSKTDVNNRGDKKALLNLHKLLGVCRAILENSTYKTLGFAPPFIMNRKVTRIQIADPSKQESTSSVMGRLTLTVKTAETSELVSPTNLTSYETSVKLHETEQGYIYIEDGN